MSLLKVPAGAGSNTLPIGGTLILLMMPDHFTTWPSWVWPVLWTLWGIVWIIVLVALFVHEEIPKAKWRQVFGEHP